MRLTFNVLWFEDTIEFLDPIIQRLRDHLDEQGFYLSEYPIEKDSENLIDIIQKINEKKLDVDLISMDYKLSGGDKGNELIKTIRDHKLLTDIIFYSQDNKFKNENKEMLEGVYLTDRKSLRDKIIAVTDHILKKTLDLSNLRGLVMAETCELDDLMDQIILTFLENNCFIEPLKEKQSIKKRVRQNLDGRLKNLDKIKIELGSPGDTRKLISNLESSLKARTLEDLLDKFIKQPGEASLNSSKNQVITAKLSSGNQFIYERYLEEVLRDRNHLGHLKESTDEKSGKKILKPTREGQECFEFDEKKAFEIRKNLRKYSEILNGIYKTISVENWN